MAKNKKPLLNEGTIRRMMKLAEIPSLSENFFKEKQGYDAEEDESVSAMDGPERDKEQSFKDRRDDSRGKWGKRDEAIAEDEEAELHATEDELGAEDAVADEEGAELDAEAPVEGEAEITPEQAAAVVELAPVIADLAASLEAGGAVEGEAEVEPEVEVDAEVVDDGEEVEAVEEIEEDIFEAALAGLGIEVIDDRASRLNEIKRKVYKKVIQRLLKESKPQKTSTPTKRKIRRRRK